MKLPPWPPAAAGRGPSRLQAASTVLRPGQFGGRHGPGNLHPSRHLLGLRTLLRQTPAPTLSFPLLKLGCYAPDAQGHCKEQVNRLCMGVLTKAPHPALHPSPQQAQPPFFPQTPAFMQLLWCPGHTGSE